ncbi:MAG TPA: hypothetical protein VJ964_09640 [Balneolaceae bacterium]|nr:hypothetical protein [Balneolaceae bacterium]
MLQLQVRSVTVNQQIQKGVAFVREITSRRGIGPACIGLPQVIIISDIGLKDKVIPQVQFSFCLPCIVYKIWNP